MATKYLNKYNDTTCYHFIIKVNPFNSNDNPYAYNASSQYVYVRGFTGTTIQQALDSKTSAGGAWVKCETGNRYGRYVRVFVDDYRSLTNSEQIVFARPEVYWPGLSQKGIKYSQIPVLCGYGTTDAENNQQNTGAELKTYVEVWLNGEKKNQYLCYGDAYMSFRKIDQNYSLPNYLTSGVTPNMEMIVDATGLTIPFYKQFNATTNINNSIFSAITSSNKYKTVSEIGWKYQRDCTTDDFTFSNCGEEWEETDCEDDECPEDCYQVCDCHSYFYCYNDTCDANCYQYSCATQIKNQCGCYSMDTNPECSEDVSFYDNCEYTRLNCFYTDDQREGRATITIPYLFKIYDNNSNDPLSMTGITYRLEGQLISRSYSATCVSISTSMSRGDYDRYFMFRVNGSVSNNVRGDVQVNSTSGSIANNARLTGITYGSDIDLTIGNRYVYDNITGANVWTAATQTNSVYANTLRINTQAYKIKRLRVYYQGNVFLDLVPVSAKCTKGNMEFATKYGLYDTIHDAFYTSDGTMEKTNYQGNAFVACTPYGIVDGDFIPTDCIYGTDTSSSRNVNFNNAISGLPLGSASFRFEGSMNYYDGDVARINLSRTTGSSMDYNGAVFSHYRYQTGTYTRLRLVWCQSSSIDTISGMTQESLYGRDLDLTVGNMYVYDNQSSSYIFSAETMTCNYTAKSLLLNFGQSAFKVSRIRVYDGNTLFRDFRAGVVMYQSIFYPALRDYVTGTVHRIDDTTVKYCPVVVDPMVDGYSLKCFSNGSLFYEKKYKEGDTIDKTLIGTPSVEGSTFVQWLPEIPDTMPDHDITVNAQYTVNQYTIYYYVDGSLYTQQSYLYGTVISQPTEPTPPEGYVFSGWDIPYSKMPAFDVNVYGTMDVYVPKYTINFYSGSTSWGSTPSCNRFKTAEYEQGATISYPTVSDTCHPLAYGGWKLSCTGGTNAPATMPADTLNVYCVTGYKVSTIHWMAKATGSTYTEYGTQNAEYLDSITDGPDLSSNAPSGYEWRGWGNSVPFSMPCEDKYVYGTFYKEAAIYYTYTLYADGQVFLQRQFEEGETIPYSGSDSVIGNLPSYAGACSITWSQPQPYVTTMPSSNVSATTVSTKSTHTLSYYVDNALYNQESVRCGSSLTAAALPNNPGYSYSSWSPSVPSTMPDNDVSVYSQSTRILYHVYYYKNNSLWATDDYYYGDTITPHALPTDIGKTYSDWNPSLPSTMPANNISTYSSSAGTQYQIYYYLYNTSGATSSTLYTTRTFTYQQSVSHLANANPPTGQFFSGWTGEPSTMPANDVYVSGWTIPSPYQLIWSYDGSPIASDIYYYTDSVYIRTPQGSSWVFNPSLLSGNKMPAANVTATSYNTCPSECTTVCSCDGEVVCDCDGGDVCGCDDEVCLKVLCLRLGCPGDVVPCSQETCPSEGGGSSYYTLAYTLFYSTYNVSNVSQMRTELTFWKGNTSFATETIYLESPGNGQAYGGTYALSFPAEYAGNWASVTADIYVKTGSGSSIWLGPYSPDGDITGIYLQSGSNSGEVNFSFTYSG